MEELDRVLEQQCEAALGAALEDRLGAALADGAAPRDVLLAAPTGSGKTLAYLLPTLAGADGPGGVLVVAPGRELAVQIDRVARRHFPDVSSTAVVGGANRKRQAEALRKAKPALVVGTPGRLAELAFEGSRPLKLGKLRWCVVDECDHALRPPFGEDVEALLGALAAKASRRTSSSSSAAAARASAAARAIVVVVSAAPRLWLSCLGQQLFLPQRRLRARSRYGSLVNGYRRPLRSRRRANSARAASNQGRGLKKSGASVCKATSESRRRGVCEAIALATATTRRCDSRIAAHLPSRSEPPHRRAAPHRPLDAHARQPCRKKAPATASGKN